MKRFTETQFFLLLKGEQSGDLSVWSKTYDDFALLLFNESVASEKAAYHNALVYTRVELEGLTEGSGEKCGCLSRQSVEIG